jgi:hypothetical protein
MSMEEPAENMESGEKKLRRSSFADDWGGEASMDNLTSEDIEAVKNQMSYSQSARGKPA